MVSHILRSAFKFSLMSSQKQKRCTRHRNYGIDASQRQSLRRAVSPTYPVGTSLSDRQATKERSDQDAAACWVALTGKLPSDR
jgi:hypothetical protein